MEHFPKCHITVPPAGIYFSLTKLPAEPDTVRLSFPLQCISIYKQSIKKKKMAGWLKNETAFPGCLSNETKTESGSHTSALGVGAATSSLSAQC